jgi:hypothetical protein
MLARSKDQTNRALLLEMAQTWATLAEKEKSASEDGPE